MNSEHRGKRTEGKYEEQGFQDNAFCFQVVVSRVPRLR
jgi:hypothetical protein